MLFLLWCIIYAASNAPDILNHNGNDTAWLVTLAATIFLGIMRG